MGSITVSVRSFVDWFSGHRSLRSRIRSAGGDAWGCSRAARIGGTGTIALVVVFFLAVGYGQWTPVLFSAVIILPALAVWFSIFRTWIGVYQSDLIIVGIILTRCIPLNEIIAIDSGYSGMVVVRADGRRYEAWAVQESNFSRWTGRETRSKRIVRVLEAHVLAAGGDPFCGLRRRSAYWEQRELRADEQEASRDD